MYHTITLYHLGSVVWRPISANPGLNFIIGFYVSLLKSRFRIILPFSFLGHLIIKLKTKRVKLSFLFKLSDLKTSFILTVGYLNPVLNNPALIMKELSMFVKFHGLAPASCIECFKYFLWLEFSIKVVLLLSPFNEIIIPRQISRIPRALLVYGGRSRNGNHFRWNGIVVCEV